MQPDCLPPRLLNFPSVPSFAINSRHERLKVFPALAFDCAIAHVATHHDSAALSVKHQNGISSSVSTLNALRGQTRSNIRKMNMRAG